MALISQSDTLLKKEMKSPVVWIFIAVYALAATLALSASLSGGLIYIGLSLGLAGLIWLVLMITKNRLGREIQIKRPILELAFACLLYLVFEYAPLNLNFGGKWQLGEILKKLVLFFVLPYIFLRLSKYSRSSMGLSTRDWKKNLKVALIVLACLAIPGAMFISNTGRALFGGQVNFFQALPAFLVYFIHNCARSGLPEEFFWRAFLQPRLSHLVRSRVGGVLATSFLFGLAHIPSVMNDNPGMPLSEAFSSVFFIQCLTALVYGVLWERTHSLIPGVIVHSGANAVNNLVEAISLVFGR